MFLASADNTSQVVRRVSESTSCKGCMFALIPPWVVAVIVSCLCSFLTVLGFVMQKKALQDKNAGRWPKLGDVVLSPVWVLGFVFAIILPLPGNLVAYALAPLSLIAPLSGFTILVNFVIAPPLLGEQRQLGPDIVASVFILTGSVLTTTTGDHENDSDNLDLDKIKELVTDRVFVVAVGILLCAMVPSILCTHLNGKSIEEVAAKRRHNPPLHHLMLPAILYGGFGCFTNIALKAVAEVMAAGSLISLHGVLVFGTVAPFAILQLNYLNRGLRLYIQVVFFPVSSALLMTTNTVYGAIFYQEYKSFADSPTNSVLFSIGIVLIVIGINVFQVRKTVKRPSHDTHVGHDHGIIHFDLCGVTAFADSPEPSEVPSEPAAESPSMSPVSTRRSWDVKITTEIVCSDTPSEFSLQGSETSQPPLEPQTVAPHSTSPPPPQIDTDTKKSPGTDQEQSDFSPATPRNVLDFTPKTPSIKPDVSVAIAEAPAVRRFLQSPWALDGICCNGTV